MDFVGIERGKEKDIQHWTHCENWSNPLFISFDFHITMSFNLPIFDKCKAHQRTQFIRNTKYEVCHVHCAWMCNVYWGLYRTINWFMNKTVDSCCLMGILGHIESLYTTLDTWMPTVFNIYIFICCEKSLKLPYYRIVEMFTGCIADTRYPLHEGSVIFSVNGTDDPAELDVLNGRLLN